MENRILRPFVNIIQTNKRYNLIYGGRAGGRSYFASQYVIAKLFSSEYFRCGIMRYIQGDIRNSIYQEILDRVEEQNLNSKELEIKDHSLTLKYKNNSVNGIGFRKSSSDQKAKLKSLAGYTDIIIEEAEEVSEEDFIQLDDSLRTIKADVRIFLLFNLPDKNHWIIRRWFNLIDCDIDGFYKPEPRDSELHNTEYVFTYYKNNEVNLNQTTIDNFLRYKETNQDHYYNMIVGLVPSGKRGIIFKNWKPVSVKEYEELDYPVFYGTDFGFSNDPACVCEIKRHNDRVYIRELIYDTGLINKRLSDKMSQLGIEKDKINYADAAEPKSIEEMKTYGWNMLPTEKGAGVRKARTNYMLGLDVYYTEDSTNLAKEIQNYCWALDKNKEPTNEPSDGNDHAIDASVSAVFAKYREKYIGF